MLTLNLVIGECVHRADRFGMVVLDRHTRKLQDARAIKVVVHRRSGGDHAGAKLALLRALHHTQRRVVRDRLHRFLKAPL